MAIHYFPGWKRYSHSFKLRWLESGSYGAFMMPQHEVISMRQCKWWHQGHLPLNRTMLEGCDALIPLVIDSHPQASSVTMLLCEFTMVVLLGKVFGKRIHVQNRIVCPKDNDEVFNLPRNSQAHGHDDAITSQDCSPWEPPLLFWFIFPFISIDFSDWKNHSFIKPVPPFYAENKPVSHTDAVLSTCTRPFLIIFHGNVTRMDQGGDCCVIASAKQG